MATETGRWIMWNPYGLRHIPQIQRFLGWSNNTIHHAEPSPAMVLPFCRALPRNPKSATTGVSPGFRRMFSVLMSRCTCWPHCWAPWDGDPLLGDEMGWDKRTEKHGHAKKWIAGLARSKLHLYYSMCAWTQTSLRTVSWIAPGSQNYPRKWPIHRCFTSFTYRKDMSRWRFSIALGKL